MTKTVPCDDSGTAIIPPTLLERITSYSLLSLYLLIPSQFIKLSYGDGNYCTIPILKKRFILTPLSFPSTAIRTSISPLQKTPSGRVSLEDVNTYPSSLSSLVNIGLMMILTMIILPTILIKILNMLLMMLLMLSAIIGTNT